MPCRSGLRTHNEGKTQAGYRKEGHVWQVWIHTNAQRMDSRGTGLSNQLGWFVNVRRLARDIPRRRRSEGERGDALGAASLSACS